MTDLELAEALAALVAEVRARPAKPSILLEERPPRMLPAFRKREPR